MVVKAEVRDQGLIDKLDAQIDELKEKLSEARFEIKKIISQIGMEKYKEIRKWQVKIEVYNEEVRPMIEEIEDLEIQYEKFEIQLLQLEAEMQKSLDSMKNYYGAFKAFTQEPHRRATWTSVILTILNATTFIMILSTMVLLTFDTVEKNAMMCNHQLGGGVSTTPIVAGGTTPVNTRPVDKTNSGSTANKRRL